MSTKIILNPIKKKANSIHFFKPSLINPEMDELPTLNLILNLYKNYVFELAYIRIAIPGNYIRFFGFKALKTILITSILAIMAFLIQLLKFLLNFKEKISFSEFLYLNYDNTNDSRKLSFVNDEWLFNPSKEFYKMLTQNKANMSDLLINQKYYKFIENIKTLSAKPEIIDFTLGSHKIEDGRTVSHFITKSLPGYDGEKCIYQTDLSKAMDSNYYGNNVYLPFFKGSRKDSILLEMNSNGIEYSSYTIKINSTHLSQGLCHSDITGFNADLTNANKFDIELISKKILLDYNNYKNTWLEFKLKSEALGIDEHQAYEIFKKICFYLT